jgi:elongation factor P
LAIDTSSFKNGMNISLDGEVFTIVEFQHVKPGKGGAFVRTRLRKLKTGQNVEKTFRAGEKVEPVFVEKKPLQYLYKSGDDVVVMDNEDYEQHQYPAAFFGDGLKYLKEGMDVTALVVGGEVWGLDVPNFVELEVLETDPVFKGDTVSGTKPATLEGGAIVAVPFHITQGDILKVDTRTDSYLERVKSG